MKPVSAGELAHIFNGALHGEPESLVSGFATDSNSVRPGDLFIAIKGERVDGHTFAADALAKGATTVLAERPIEGSYILVSNVVHALGDYGRHYRNSFHGPVVGITGSAGKTTTKEFVASALGPLGPVLKSTGNRNTEYTSPLVWSDLEPGTKAAVVEMAMRGFGQIAHLAAIAKPTIGLITNIGYSHLLQVGDRHGIARAKGELLQGLSHDGTAVLWRECEFFEQLRQIAGDRQILTFGTSADANCRVTGYEPIDWSMCRVEGTCEGKHWHATLPAVGRHIALDAAAAILVASAQAIEPQAAANALQGTELPPMRMEIRKRAGAVVLLDTYNAAPPSVLSALETLAEIPAAGRKLAVLGEMRELGDYAEGAHRMVGRAVKKHGLDGVVFIGDSMRFASQEALGVDSVSSKEDARQLVEELRDGDVLLVKGSRALELERVLD
ncbi:MAG TPA: UDP-N-acetylmuramoyl-tripeptide--D-alanyl-D-alanine ligase [Fimbriimonas sp.]|nr:UDP-N-acetylmuramoyl-tripeptide--D-alanyl-D-alanine ligase [Fimbriimonas sp.]